MAKPIRDLEGRSPYQIPEHIHESVKQCRGGCLLVPYDLYQSNENQKQSQGVILFKKCSKEFSKIRRKTPVPEPLF